MVSTVLLFFPREQFSHLSSVIRAGLNLTYMNSCKKGLADIPLQLPGCERRREVIIIQLDPTISLSYFDIMEFVGLKLDMLDTIVMTHLSYIKTHHLFIFHSLCIPHLFR